MNEDHAISIYAMSKQKLGASAGGQLSNVKLKNVSLNGCRIQAIKCSGMMCEQQLIDYPFNPSLTNASQVRSKMVEIHHNVMKPQILTIVKSQPISILIVIAYAVLFYGTLIQQGILSMPSSIVNGTLSDDSIYYWINLLLNHMICPIGFYVTSIAHCYEMLHVIYHSRKTLQLSLTNLMLWSIVVFIGGFPFWNEYKDLLNYQQQQQQEKEKNKKS